MQLAFFSSDFAIDDSSLPVFFETVGEDDDLPDLDFEERYVPVKRTCILSKCAGRMFCEKCLGTS